MSTDSHTPTADRERGTHPAHVGHLVMGLAFLGLVAIWAVVESGAVATNDVRWLLPLPWVFAGAAGLVAAVFSGRRPRRDEPVPAYAAPAYSAPAYAGLEASPDPTLSDLVDTDPVDTDTVDTDPVDTDGQQVPDKEEDR
jgi:hypothetical protein